MTIDAGICKISSPTENMEKELVAEGGHTLLKLTSGDVLPLVKPDLLHSLNNANNWGTHAQMPERMWDISHSNHESGRDDLWDPLLTE